MGVRRAVYTALIGGYEDLINQPTAHGSSVEFICFTDNPHLESTTWRLEPMTPMLPFDMVRSQREIKIRGHRLLDEFDELLYIDNAVLLTADPDSILDSWLADHDYAVSRHSVRETVLDEFEQILALGYDDAARVTEQLLHYAELYPDVLEQRPFWNGMFAWRNTPDVRVMMSHWFDHVLRYSRRDQLSANVAFSQSTVALNVIEMDNNQSPLHSWPAGVNRRANLTLAPRRHTGPMLAELRRLEVINQANEAEILALGRRAAEAQTRARELQDTIEAMRSSRRWRLGEFVSNTARLRRSSN